MRTVFALLSVLIAIALAAPDSFADWIQPFYLEDQSSPAQDNSTLNDGNLELLKRQNNGNCYTNYYACSTIAAPNVCCPTTALCSVDGANHAACCPLGSACTGTILPVSPGTASASTTGTAASTTTTGTFVIIGSTTTTISGATATFVQTSAGVATRSTVPNSYYPIAFIPTTYTDAAACSSAYTSCTNDASSCSAALASGRQGVTISAPNGGATVTAIASLGEASASSICASLSSEACSGLQVQACSSFGGTGGGGYMACGDIVAVGAGVAVGLAGQLLR